MFSVLNGYEKINDKDVLKLGCMMHSRRRFNDAYIIGKKKPGLASEALAMLKWLYDKEESYKNQELTPESRKIIRDKEIAPSMLAIKQWCELWLLRVPKSSPIGNAFNYFIEQYAELSAFLKDGRYEIDNGWIERTIRKFGIGRNNWLFCDTVEGAHASGMLYGLAITAKLNRRNPFTAMSEVFELLPDARTVDDYEKLAGLLLSPPNLLSCRKKDG